MARAGHRSRDVVDAFIAIRDRATLGRFFAELFTPAEIRDVRLRWELMRLLRAGVPQREIARRLGISLCKITRGARVLRQKGSVSARLLAPTAGQDASGRRGTLVAPKRRRRGGP